MRLGMLIEGVEEVEEVEGVEGGLERLREVKRG
jgi:hypothetical protein